DMSQDDSREVGILTRPGGTGRPEGISGKKTFVVAPMPDGRIWLGVNGGIDIIDPLRGRVGQITALPKGRVQSIVADAGVVYIATQQVLYRGDVNGQHLVRMTVPGRSPTSSVRELCLVGKVLWVGG